MDPRSFRRRLPALALVGVFFLTPAVRALPLSPGPDGPAAMRETSAGLLAWLGQTLSRLWAEESTDTGKLIDPNGGATGQDAGGSAGTDTGMLIDPNG